MRRMPLRYSPSQTNDSSSNLSVSRSSVLLLETPSLTSFQVSGSLMTSSLVFIFKTLSVVSFFGKYGGGEIIPAGAGIKKTVGIAFLFTREKDEQVSGEGFLEAIDQFGDVQKVVEIHQASQGE